ncbi:MAG TPA: 3'(2'),5'-bisphosphate nucleotidase CysQ [Stellaceae bacterium]|nr:3'(2'),5'-bisphosphate nucleotidase CysQ [Stellaceae bacterium]
MIDAKDKAALLDLAIAAALKAGPPIMAVYAEDFAVRRKEDQSPVTQADELAEATILEMLEREAPDIAAIAEERETADASGAAPARFWVIDPLDGTKEFVARNGEFTVNIGLIEGGAPVLGVIYAPSLDLLYAASGPGTAKRRKPDGTFELIAARPVPKEGAVIVHSRSHINSPRIAEFAATLPGSTRIVSGSAIKFCKLAAGEADIYPRFGPTMEWDTGAGQAILEAAGGSIVNLDGARLAYGKPAFRNAGFIARGRTS